MCLYNTVIISSQACHASWPFPFEEPLPACPVSCYAFCQPRAYGSHPGRNMIDALQCARAALRLRALHAHRVRSSVAFACSISSVRSRAMKTRTFAPATLHAAPPIRLLGSLANVVRHRHECDPQLQSAAKFDAVAPLAEAVAEPMRLLALITAIVTHSGTSRISTTQKGMFV